MRLLLNLQLVLGSHCSRQCVSTLEDHLEDQGRGCLGPGLPRVVVPFWRLSGLLRMAWGIMLPSFVIWEPRENFLWQNFSPAIYRSRNYYWIILRGRTRAWTMEERNFGRLLFLSTLDYFNLPGIIQRQKLLINNLRTQRKISYGRISHLQFIGAEINIG